MGSIYKRGKIWWVAYLDASGTRHLRSSGQRDERVARGVLEDIEAAVASGELKSRPSTVARWAEEWAAGRKNWTAAEDYGRLKKHVIPVLGPRRLGDITRNEVRALVTGWRDGGQLAPRTIRNVFWVMSRLFSDAVANGLLEKSPCLLVKGDRPKIRDKDRRWRQTAVFTRPEAQQLISDDRVPADRRTMWALGFFGGLRLGEVSALRWRDYDAVRKPLGCLHISSSFTRVNKVEKSTKTEVARQVPVHPELAELLADWRSTGWAKLFGSAPKEDDLMIPNRAGRHLNDQNVNESRGLDFASLSMRRRRFHDARRTFISLAQVDGAVPHVLKLITHGAPSEVMDLYTSLPWEKLCEAVGLLQLQRSPGGPRLATVGPLHSLLQTGGEGPQPLESETESLCPRRDSNPSGMVTGDHSGRGSRSAGTSVFAVAGHSFDGDRSSVAASRGAELGRRARAVLEKYRGAA